MTRAGPGSTFADHLVDRAAPHLVWGLWAVMSATALLSATWAFRQRLVGQWAQYSGVFMNAALPAAGAFAFILAVRRVRGRTRIADGFFPLVLLNPLLFTRAAAPFDAALLAAGLLGLMAGAIIAMKRSNYLRYLAVAALALGLTRISDAFIMLLPPLVMWMLLAAYSLATSPLPGERVRGFAVMAAAEIALLVFALACILVEPSPTPHPATLFSTIVSFTEFPMLVLAIIMLALGWRTSPAPPPPDAPQDAGEQASRLAGTRTPPYFWGMLALLVGLLVMLLSNFQAGQLPAPGADQTVVILCLLYTVSALHGPRRLHYLLPPVLLAGAAVYTLMR